MSGNFDAKLDDLNRLLSATQADLDNKNGQVRLLLTRLSQLEASIAIRLPCPACKQLHIDVGEFATKRHHTHACQYCGNVWRPAIVDTVGVQFLPGFKNESDD